MEHTSAISPTKRISKRENRRWNQQTIGRANRGGLVVRRSLVASALRYSSCTLCGQTRHTIEVHRLVPHEYAQALSMLSFKLHKNEHDILPDMYFLSLLYRKKLEQCPAIWKHISPKIKEIYRMKGYSIPLDLYEKFIPKKTT